MEYHQLIDKLEELSFRFGFSYSIIHYQEQAFFHVRISGLSLQSQIFDLRELCIDDITELNFNLEDGKMIDSIIHLPNEVNQVEFIKCNLITTSVELTTDPFGTIPILGLTQCQADSLSMFDKIDQQFILQVVDSNLNQIHTMATIPQGLQILSVTM